VFFSCGVLPYFTQTGGITPLGVFSNALPGNKMRVHLLTASGTLVIWAVLHPITIRAQRCLTLVIKCVPVCPTWQDAVLYRACGFCRYVCLQSSQFRLLYSPFTVARRKRRATASSLKKLHRKCPSFASIYGKG
jgi:hypothetical protein